MIVSSKDFAQRANGKVVHKSWQTLLFIGTRNETSFLLNEFCLLSHSLSARTTVSDACMSVECSMWYISLWDISSQQPHMPACWAKWAKILKKIRVSKAIFRVRKPVKPHSLALDRSGWWLWWLCFSCGLRGEWREENNMFTVLDNTALLYHSNERPLPWRHCSLKGHFDFKCALSLVKLCFACLRALLQLSLNSPSSLETKYTLRTRRTSWIDMISISTCCYATFCFSTTLFCITCSLLGTAWALDKFFCVSFMLHFVTHRTLKPAAKATTLFVSKY